MTVVAEAALLPPPPRTETGLLERVALALSSTLELKEVLRLLAEISLDATHAERTSVFLLEDGWLRPAAAARASDDEIELRRFQAMAPIELDERKAAHLGAGRAVVIDDARRDDLVPGAWATAFDLRGLVVVPLAAAGEPCGLMAVEWPDGTAPADPASLVLLEAIGAYAGVAIRNARLFDGTRRRARLQEALAQSAASLASPLDPHVIAQRLVDAYADLLGARLCGIALLDPTRDQITSITSRGARPLPGPMPLSQVPDRIVERLWGEWAVAKRAVEIADDPWLADEVGGAAAGASWYLFVPLVVDAHSRGVVVLGFDARTRLQADERSAAEALADIAAAALERHELLGRLDRQLHRLETLYEASAGLNSSPSLASALDLVCGAFEQLLGASHCSINLIDPEAAQSFRTLAARGVAWLHDGPQRLDAIAPAELERITALWRDAPRPVVYADIDEQAAVDPALIPASVRSGALFPLVHGGEVFGVVVAGFRALGGPGDGVDTGQALADLAAAAIDRGRLDDALRLRLRQVEALYRLSDVVAGDVDLDVAVGELNRLFEPELAVRFGSVAVANRKVREAVGGRAPEGDELEAIRSWRALLGDRRRPLAPRQVDGGILVPVVHRSRVLGALPVAIADPDIDDTVGDLLVAIGAGCAEVIYKSGLHRDLAERERRLAVASERERIGRDLHDSVGQLLTGMGMRLTQYRDEAPDAAWEARVDELVELADRGSREVRQSIYALLFLDARRHGLVPSLRELTARFEATTGVRVSLRVHGRPVALVAAKEEAIFRATHEALMNVERHARASRTWVTLTFGADAVTLEVRDDGVGLAGAAAGCEHGRFGVHGMRRRIEECGGSLRLRDAEPHGAAVEVHLPVTPDTKEVRRASRPRGGRR